MDDLSRELDDISIFTAEDEAELEQALEIQPTGVEDATVSSSKSKGIEIQTIQGQLVNESYAAEVNSQSGRRILLSNEVDMDHGG